MTKKMISETKGVYFDFGYLSEMKISIELMIDEYGEKAILSENSSDSGSSYEITFEREETDAEYNKRLKREKKQKEIKTKTKKAAEDRERKEYERLKKKYG